MTVLGVKPGALGADSGRRVVFGATGSRSVDLHLIAGVENSLPSRRPLTRLVGPPDLVRKALELHYFLRKSN